MFPVVRASAIERLLLLTLDYRRYSASSSADKPFVLQTVKLHLWWFYKNRSRDERLLTDLTVSVIARLMRSELENNNRVFTEIMLSLHHASLCRCYTWPHSG